MEIKEKDVQETPEPMNRLENPSQPAPPHPIVEEIMIEELAVDGICGVY